MCSHAQGPPGTGKTRTLLALLEILARIGAAPGRLQRMGPILACADTNAATDNLVEGLVERGINVTRLGQPAKVTKGALYLGYTIVRNRTLLVNCHSRKYQTASAVLCSPLLIRVCSFLASTRSGALPFFPKEGAGHTAARPCL